METKQYINKEQLHKAPLLAIDQLQIQVGSSLILAPHPDDEVLGCGGMITYLRQQNVNVQVCFITSGGASHPNSKTHSKEVLKNLRKKEARNACEILGVSSDHVIFLDKEDAYVNILTDIQVTEIASHLAQIISEFEITSLFLPWRRDPHPDHVATYNFGLKAKKISGEHIQIVEYPIWMWHSSDETLWPNISEVETFRLDIDTVLDTKKAAIFAHTSQTTNLISDDDNGFMLTKELLTPFLNSFEVFFFNPKEATRSLNKDYFDALYFHNSDPWNFVESAYEQTKFEKIDTFLGARTYDHALELGCSIGVQSKLLAKHCNKLLAVDISEDAIATAKASNIDLKNIDFRVMNVLEEFPKGPFQFISMCEIGYFFSQEDLLSVFHNIAEALTTGGQFLMVHWTSYVREFPLTGRQVHETFDQFNSESKKFKRISSFIHEKYELILWEKLM